MREKINLELKKSVINKDTVATKTLRLIIAAIKDRDIVVRSDGNQNGIDDSEIINLLKKMKKQREDSIIMYSKGKRDDLVKNEQDEIKIINEFLPKQLSEEEILKIVDNAIKTNNAVSIKDMGKVMSSLKENYAANMDFAQASKIVKELLM